MKALLLLALVLSTVYTQPTVDDLEIELLKERVSLMKEKLKMLENLQQNSRGYPELESDILTVLVPY